MSKPIRVLIVEDSENDALLLVRELRRGGFEPEFERVDTPEAMTAALADGKWDIVIADYTMPRFSGIAALELLKQSGLDLPFIVVSGSIGEDVAVAAMKAGAHDYLMKGNIQRLLPSIERELREAEIRHQRRRAAEEAQRHAERIKALHEIDLAITSTLDLQAVLNILLEKIDLVLPYSATTVRLFHGKTGELEPVACRNVNKKEWQAISHHGLQGLARIVVEGKSPLTVSNVQTDPRNAAPDFTRNEGLVSYIGVPLIAKDEVLGLIAFYTKKQHSFDDHEIEFLTTLAGLAAIAIHNATLYEQNKRQLIELEKSNNVKDEFLGVMSHELRTPLNVAMGYATLLKDGVLGEINSEQRKALEVVLSHSNGLLKMINSILYATSLEAEGSKVNSVEVSLVNLLDDLKAEYAIPLEKELAMLWDFRGDLPVIKTDRTKLKQILQNLLNNAIKFTDNGRVALMARYLPQANAIQFEVSDTGVGIPMENLPFIFERFRQADSSMTRLYNGVGLGLFIVRKFTEMLGGTVAVESELDKGSTFTITLPVEFVTSTEPDVRTGIQSTAKSHS